MEVDWQCVEAPPRSEKADCLFKVWAIVETDESALHQTAKQMLFPSC